MREKINNFKRSLRETYTVDYILKQEDPKHVAEVKRRMVQRNYTTFPATAIAVLLVSVIFVVGDITSGFYEMQYPYSMLNLAAEIASSAIGILMLINLFDRRERTEKVKHLYSSVYLLFSSMICSLYLLSDSMRQVTSSTPYFALMLLVLVPSLFEKEFLVYYGIYMLPTIIYYIVSGNFDAFSFILNMGGYLLHLYLLAAYVREMLLKIKYEESNEELLKMNWTDFLTKIGNRKMLYETIDKNRKRWIAERKDICLVMMDIDNFKCYNDTYSHLKGDECLISVVSAVNQALEDHSLSEITFIRFGGEEFLIMMVGTNLEQELYDIYRDIRKNMEKLAIPSGEGANYPYVTISAGAEITAYTEGLVIEELMRRADDRLYKAKKNGRDALGYREQIIREVQS